MLAYVQTENLIKRCREHLQPHTSHFGLQNYFKLEAVQDSCILWGFMSLKMPQLSCKCYKIIMLEDMYIVQSGKISPIMTTLKPHLELSIISWHLSNFITPSLLEHSLRQWSPGAEHTLTTAEKPTQKRRDLARDP